MDREANLARVSLETTQDWKRVKAKFAKVALSNMASGPSASLPPPRQEAITLHMNHVCIDSDSSTRANLSVEFLSSAFQKAELNLRVNGQNFEGPDSEQGANYHSHYFSPAHCLR